MSLGDLTEESTSSDVGLDLDDEEKEKDDAFISSGELHPLLTTKKTTSAMPTVSPEYRRQRYERRKQVFSCCLAALSGFADVLCHHAFGCYGNMMTGNTIRLMDSLSAGRWEEAAYPATLVPAYILGAALCTYLNKLDLTVLGLGGPSQQAFAHLNPPRRLRSPQQISVLRVVAVTSVVFFLLAEAIVYLNHWDTKWRLPFFACAFGLLNAATLAAIHLVTNAVTGHWITVGLGVADDLPVLLNRQSSTVSGSGRDAFRRLSSATMDVAPPQTAAQKRWKSSSYVAASFIGSIIVTSIVYNEYLRQREIQGLLARFVDAWFPPMGVFFAFLYTIALYWYTRPPPFLHGYHSSADLVSFT